MSDVRIVNVREVNPNVLSVVKITIDGESEGVVGIFACSGILNGNRSSGVRCDIRSGSSVDCEASTSGCLGNSHGLPFSNHINSSSFYSSSIWKNHSVVKVHFNWYISCYIFGKSYCNSS